MWKPRGRLRATLQIGLSPVPQTQAHNRWKEYAIVLELCRINQLLIPLKHLYLLFQVHLSFLVTTKQEFAHQLLQWTEKCHSFLYRLQPNEKQRYLVISNQRIQYSWVTTVFTISTVLHFLIAAAYLSVLVQKKDSRAYNFNCTNFSIFKPKKFKGHGSLQPSGTRPSPPRLLRSLCQLCNVTGSPRPANCPRANGEWTTW